MPKKEYEMENVAEEMRRQQKHWFTAAQTAHDDWAAMKYSKGMTAQKDFPSKKDFDDYRRKVFQFHKYYLYRSKVCGRIADFLDGEVEELNFKGIKEDSVLKKAGKILFDNFLSPSGAEALKNGGGRN